MVFSIIISIVALVLAVTARQQITALRKQVEQLQRQVEEKTQLAPVARENEKPIRRFRADEPLTATSAREIPPAEPVGTPIPAMAASARLDPKKVAEIMSGKPSATPVTVRATPTPSVPAARPKKSYGDFERSLGRNWPVWIGGVALFLGGIFVVQYSIENELLGPGIRLCLGAVFGLLLLGAGEYLRRKEKPLGLSVTGPDYIPGVLTAAGSAALFAVVYAAHGIYGFIGSPTAFVALGAVGLATLALAIKHGPWIAGLGLIGSYLTPALVNSQAPAPYSFMTYLSIVTLVAVILSRAKNWPLIGAGAIVLAALWGSAYTGFDPMPNGGALGLLTVSLLALSVLSHLKPGNYTLFDRTEEPSYDPITIAGAVGAVFLGLGYVSHDLFGLASFRFLVLAAIVIAVSTLAPLFIRRALPFLVPAALISLVPLTLVDMHQLLESGFDSSGLPLYDPAKYRGFAILVALAFTVISVIAATILARLPDIVRGIAYAALGTAVPFVMITMMIYIFGNTLASTEEILSVGLAIIGFGSATWLTRLWKDNAKPISPAWLFDAASIGFAVLALFTVFEPQSRVLAACVLAFIYAVATRTRIAPVLRFAPAVFAVIILGHILFDPTIVGSDRLSTTPLFNQLLLNYGGFFVAMIVAQIVLAKEIKDTAYRLVQALAVLAGFVLVNILVRHWMNGGTLDSGGDITLSEQSLYTLIALGGSLSLMMLSKGGQDWLYRTAALLVGYVGILVAVTQHFIFLNPLFDGSVGDGLIFNSLFMGYLLPGLLAALVALNAFGEPQIKLFGLPLVMAQANRPRHYAMALAILSGLMLFTWVTLTIRVFFWGSDIDLWLGVDSMEMFTYSAVWLLFGLGLFGLGAWRQNRLLRVISAPIVFLVIAKVFLLDMSNLEGILRALSFIGLGLSLVGVGLFYQRILNAGAAATPPTSDENGEPDRVPDPL
ncbi:DUF2339 domain-containing protein [Phyllobacterium myrsinacearum]|uniref:Putative membrane protein n=1 Tax=Phyllobacterium myrsinacearum TaxID=28101 RepID=A0A839EFA1_9HYPH|nr:DUF2339 domain-containing protein [Phyllobacterium myrsinacearum]MBA8877439.1 putative membrane protein [Phyllobacterium myrsinacearum]